MASKFQPTRRRARSQDERGIAIVLICVMMAFIVPMVGLSVDAGTLFVIRSRVSAAVDSAALAAGRSLNLGQDLSTAQAAAISGAQQFFNANFPSGFMSTSTSGTTVNATFNMLTDANGNPNGVLQIGVNAAVQAPTYFMRWFNIPAIRVNGSGTATRKSLVMMLVLDQSASMGSRSGTPGVGNMPTSLPAGASSCEAMVYSAGQFINYFSPYDYVGMINFDYTAHLGYAPSTSFRNSGSSGVTQAIANIDCGNNTNTTAALNLAYTQIKNVGWKLANNVIVLFTDGVANGVTANFPIRKSQDDRYGGPVNTDSNGNPYPALDSSHNGASNKTACLDGSGTQLCQGMPVCNPNTNQTTVYGVISQVAGFSTSGGGRGGLFKAFDSDNVGSTPNNCPNSGSSLSQTIAYIPDTDFFGNSTHGPKDAWLYQVNNQCAPAGTPLSAGASLCKNIGDYWSNYNGTGIGAPSNLFQSGPYQGKFRPDTPNSIGVTSMNSAINQAATIRADTNYHITIEVIYLQGNGGDPVDREFLPIIANQAVIPPLVYQPSGTANVSNSYYQSTQQTGLYLQTTNNAQLALMFAQIASSLLRISQ